MQLTGRIKVRLAAKLVSWNLFRKQTLVTLNAHQMCTVLLQTINRKLKSER